MPVPIGLMSFGPGPIGTERGGKRTRYQPPTTYPADRGLCFRFQVQVRGRRPSLAAAVIRVSCLGRLPFRRRPAEFRFLSSVMGIRVAFRVRVKCTRVTFRVTCIRVTAGSQVSESLSESPEEPESLYELRGSSSQVSESISESLSKS